MRRAITTVVTVLAAGLLLGACTSDPNSVANQAKQGNRKGYLSGDGTIERIPVAKRGPVVDLSGTTVDGKPWSSADARGKALVVNVWGSWCSPCVAEAPDLQQAWANLSAARKPVEFIGIDVQESALTGAAFLKSRAITYPSLTDQPGVLILALQGKAVATPTTLVLDTSGRIAGRVSGPVTTTTLTDLVDDVLSGATG
ncbi:MAG: TlpA disulfide reductase family protein [Nostocoides sp.]